MASIYITLETVTGCTPEEVMVDACRVADTLCANVLMDVNGVQVVVCPKNDPGELHRNWKKAITEGRKYACALDQR